MADQQADEVETLERVFGDSSAEPIKISYAAIKYVTKNFAQVIGDGGFGVVYLGGLQNGMVAVKKLSASTDISDKQFLDEVACLKKVNHKNIVRFLGYCADTQGEVMEVEGALKIVEVQQRLLCFEYAPNGSLHHYLKEKTYGHEWNMRYQIIKGICEGLQYLHRQRIYHLDLKPANVLLGAKMVPQITDFGVSRCVDEGQSTMVTKNMFGTLGYVAPEFIDKQEISPKTDVYSLGIIMINMLTRRSGSVIDNWQETLDVDCPQMKKCIEIAQSCINRDPHKRPTMGEIIGKLNETEAMIQRDPPIIKEPKDDPKSSLYQVVQRFQALTIQTLREYSRMDNIYTELNLLESILEGSQKPTNLSYQLLQFITENFSEERMVNVTGSGEIYKGILGSVAVKRFSRVLKRLSGDLPVDDRMFHQEVESMKNAEHPNIVRFLGYCSYTEEKSFEIEGSVVTAEIRERLLCFEYLCNGSLANHLSGVSDGLEWRERYQIIKGVCEGLHYLHANRIAHLDLKPASILLDENMMPRISDFCLSRFFEENQSRAVTSKLIGSMGYLAPEFFSQIRTLKLDIFSLGVIILEILTGGKSRQFTVEEVVVSQILESWKNRLGTSATDSILAQVRVCAEISIACMQEDPTKRPVTQCIIEMLKRNDCKDGSTKTGLSVVSVISTGKKGLQQVAAKYKSGTGTHKLRGTLMGSAVGYLLHDSK